MKTTKEMRSEIMSKAHAMCREMKEKGFEFDYKAQLGINLKYLWSVAKGEIEEATESGEMTDKITEEEEIEEIDIKIVSCKKGKETYTFKMLATMGDEQEEFLALAHPNHKLPICYGTTNIAIREHVKTLIEGTKVKVYNSLDNVVPDYRYYTYEDLGLFIYYDEESNVFKGFYEDGYCENGAKYGGRAFVFDIKDNKGPCSRAFRQLMKDYDNGEYKAFTPMNGKGVTITKWRDIILEKCREIYKETMNRPKINFALAVIKAPWKHDIKVYTAAIKLLQKLNVEFTLIADSYEDAIDKEFKHILKVRAGGNKNYGTGTIKKFPILAAKYGLVKTVDNENKEGGGIDAFADVDI